MLSLRAAAWGACIIFHAKSLVRISPLSLIGSTPEQWGAFALVGGTLHILALAAFVLYLLRIDDRFDQPVPVRYLAWAWTTGLVMTAFNVMSAYAYIHETSISDAFVLASVYSAVALMAALAFLPVRTALALVSVVFVGGRG